MGSGRRVWIDGESLNDHKSPTGFVDGRDIAPPGIYKALEIMEETTYQLVQDFFHQQLHWLLKTLSVLGNPWEQIWVWLTSVFLKLEHVHVKTSISKSKTS